MELDIPSPPKMTVTNVNTEKFIKAQFNPTEWEEVLGVNWARLGIPGLSHQRLNYINTNNETFAFTLFFLGFDKIADLEKIYDDRRFLMSLCYPQRASQDLLGGSPPRALFTWPGIATIQTVVTQLTFRYTNFNKLAQPTSWTCRVALEEIRDVRLFSDDVRARGTQRSGRSGR